MARIRGEERSALESFSKNMRHKTHNIMLYPCTSYDAFNNRLEIIPRGNGPDPLLQHMKKLEQGQFWLNRATRTQQKITSYHTRCHIL